MFYWNFRARSPLNVIIQQTDISDRQGRADARHVTWTYDGRRPDCDTRYCLKHMFTKWSRLLSKRLPKGTDLLTLSAKYSFNRSDRGKSYPEWPLNHRRNSTFRPNSINISNNFLHRKNSGFLVLIRGLDVHDLCDFDPICKTCLKAVFKAVAFVRCIMHRKRA